jgi:Fur family ferric uptake transcriptional regulator
VTRPSLIERVSARENWRLTAQRRVVAEVLDGQHVHLSADEVLERAQRRLPEISLATIYNTLNELVAMGEVRAFRGRAGGVRYDPNADGHHHLVCDGCGAIFDVSPAGVEGLALDVRCADCR